MFFGHNIYEVMIMKNKDGLGNPMQKGERRQRLHQGQNNVGNPRKSDFYTNHQGEEIK